MHQSRLSATISVRNPGTRISIQGICHHAKDFEMKEFLVLCFTKNIVKRASVTALVVGAILIVINQGDALLSGQVNANLLFKIILTVLVPYTVSTVSSASTILSLRGEAHNF